MLRFLWVGLLAAALLAVGVSSAASPGVTACGASVSLALDASSATVDPLARWLNQIAEMINLTVRAAKWDSAQSVALTLNMGSAKAFSLAVIEEEGVTTLSSSLLDESVRLTLLSDWAQALFQAAEGLYAMPTKGRLIPVSGEGLARAMYSVSVKLRSWASTARAVTTEACQGCGECASCRRAEASDALAIVIDSIAMEFDEVVDKNVLVISVEPFDVVEAPPTARASAEAPPDINVRLVKDAMWATAVAIADNEPAADEPAIK